MTEEERRVLATSASVEEAIAEGLAQLSLSRDAVEIEVLDEGSSGFLGLGRREARVRLTPVAAAPVEQPAVAEAVPIPVEAPPPPPPPPPTRDEGQIAQDVLQELVDKLGLPPAHVSVRRAEPAPGETAPPLVLDVRGKGMGALIGRRGQTLAALQHITRLIVGRELEGRANLVVDIEGYKARREQTLRRLAQQMGEQAVRTGRTVILEPMPPHERRIVHLTLRDHPHVVTESVGEGDKRQVTIIPRR